MVVRTIDDNVDNENDSSHPEAIFWRETYAPQCVARVSFDSSNDILFIRLRTTENKQAYWIIYFESPLARRSNHKSPVFKGIKHRALPLYPRSLNRSRPYGRRRPALQLTDRDERVSGFSNFGAFKLYNFAKRAAIQLRRLMNVALVGNTAFGSHIRYVKRQITVPGTEHRILTSYINEC